MKKALAFTSIAALSLAACSGTKEVSNAVPDKAIGSWQVVTSNKNQASGLCYAFSAPLSSEGNFTGKRGTAYVMATRRPSGKIEVSVSSGYSYRKASDVRLVTDSTTFKLKPKDAVAWAINDAHDRTLVAELSKTDSFQVHGIAANGQGTTEYYSAEGFTAALDRVKALCP